MSDRAMDLLPHNFPPAVFLTLVGLCPFIIDHIRPQKRPSVAQVVPIVLLSRAKKEKTENPLRPSARIRQLTAPQAAVCLFLHHPTTPDRRCRSSTASSGVLILARVGGLQLAQISRPIVRRRSLPKRFLPLRGLPPPIRLPPI